MVSCILRNLIEKKLAFCFFLGIKGSNAPIAQLDRASDYGSEGYGFDSCWARHFHY